MNSDRENATPKLPEIQQDDRFSSVLNGPTGNAYHFKINEPPTVADVFIAEEISRQQIADIVGGITPVHGGGTCGIILHGPYGTGKSMLARMLPSEIDRSLAKTQSEPNLFVHEQTQHTWHDCEEARAQDIFRNIRASTGLVCLNPSSLHFVILDEVDHFGVKAMKSLRGLMSASRDTVFILTTNNINSIDSGVRNRCIEVSMAHGTEAQLTDLAFQITRNNALGLLPADVEKAVKGCAGSIRKLVNQLQTVINRTCEAQS